MVVTAADAQSTAPAVPRRRWPFVVIVVGLILIAGGTVAAVRFAHWRESLHPLAAYPVGGVRSDVAAGHALYFGDMADTESAFSHPDAPGTLTLHISSIQAVVGKNTAAATIEVEKCVLRSYGHELDGQPSTWARARCATLTPFRSGTVRLGFRPGDVDLVVAIRPEHAGVTDVHGVQLSFTAGWRHGTQHTGLQAGTVSR